jgi:tRNA(fMet)-specific endonuclease VapC
VTYLLDTDICSYLMKRSHPALIERVTVFPARELKVSMVTVFELEYGARRSGRYDALLRVIQAFLDNLETLPVDFGAAKEAGAIRAELAAARTTIGAYDLLIAGHARSLGATLVTNNVRELSRVADLAIENWVGDRKEE